MTLLYIDLESRASVDLPKRGSHVYWEDPHADVLVACFAFDDGPVHTWVRGDPAPPDIRAHVEAGGLVSGWNVFNFERLAFNAVLGPRYGWPVPKIEQYTDTMHMAAAMALPQALGKAADALGLPIRKDREGTRLINRFSKPRRTRKDEDPGAVLWNEPGDFREDFERFVDYCQKDVEVERAIRKRLVPLSDSEQKLAILNARINERGLKVDVRSARSAIKLAEKAKAHLDREMRLATGGYVTACSQPGKLVAWVQDQGVAMDSAAKAEVEAVLERPDLPDNVRRALGIRLEAAKTSVSKLNAMLARANKDGRVRGSYIYHGASTGRFQAAGVNMNNLPRSRPAYGGVRQDVVFEAIRHEDPEVLRFLFGDDLGRPLHLLSDAIRGFIWAAPGHEFVQADYSGIESAVIAWLAGEESVLRTLRDILKDPTLPDIYMRAAADILNIPLSEMTKGHWARQAVGKISVLALGFGGGVSAFEAMARGYGVDLDGLYGPVWGQASEEYRERAVRRYENEKKRGKSKTDVLSREAWIACEIIKLGWRAANPAIAQSWRDLETAAREAVANPGIVTEAAKCRYTVRLGFLWCQLPSGRCLAYGSPRLKDQVWAKVLLEDGSWSEAEVMDRDEAERLELKGKVKIEGTTSAKVTALSVDSATKKWRRFGLYGGLAAENVTQATARDLLVNGMWKAEAAGYPIVATVYDEILAEVPRGFGDLVDFERLICELPDWAEGLPLTAGGWRGKRYRKD